MELLYVPIAHVLLGELYCIMHIFLHEVIIYFFRLSKVCNHVGSLLQVCLVAAQIREERTCTEELCTWANPNYKRPVRA